MKKILSLLLAMAMLFSLCPTFTMAAEAATNDVKLFDAHITGNVVIGGTLTANFKPSDPDAVASCNLDMEKTLATVTWYLRNRNGSGNGNKSLSATGKTYTIPDDWASLTVVKNAANPSIYFTVTPKDADGNDIGPTIYSKVTYSPAAVDADAEDIPVAYNATIVPQNAEGSINVGDTVAAHFSFRYLKDKAVTNGNSKYTWYTSDTMLANADIEANATVVQAESTDPYYTIKPADAGKWIYAKVTPVSTSGSEGVGIYTKNHLGNAFLDAEVIDSGVVSPVNLRASTYPSIMILADGTSRTTSNDASTYVYTSSNTKDTSRKFVVDAGKFVTFDTLHFRHAMSSVYNLVIGYSVDNVDWTIVKSDASTLTATQYELDCGGVKSARYFKFEFVTAEKQHSMIDEFYPFLKNDITFEGYSYKKFASVKDGIINVEAWGTPLSELHKKENGIIVKSSRDAEGSTENADNVLNSGISYVIKSVASDGVVAYSAIENPENVYVTEATENTFMKITSVTGVSQYVEIVYAGDDLHEVETEKEVEGASETNSSRHPIGTVYFSHRAEDGFASGKYLMKTQVYLPDYSRVELKVKQGGTGMTGGQMRNVLFFMGNATPYAQVSGSMTYYQGDIGVPNLAMDTGFNYRVGKWYDLEVLFDYDKIDRNENMAISISAWVDGVQVVDEAVISCANAAAKDRISPAFMTYPNTGLTGVKMRNSSFRQVWDADTHVTQAPVNEIKIVNTADENADAVTTLTAGTYALSNTMNVYEGNGIVDYIAKYYVTGTSTELAEVAAVRNTATDFVTVTAEELEDANKRVVLKAISFKNGLTPNYASVVVSE